MNEGFKNYSDKFLLTTPREQFLILFTGIVVLFLIIYNYFIDDNLTEIEKKNKTIVSLTAENNSTQRSIELIEQALLKDPNKVVENQIAKYEEKLIAIDESLMNLTSDLISPVEMRIALQQLLKMERGVKLLSFEVLPVAPLMTVKNTVVNEVPVQSDTPEKLMTDQEKELNQLLTVYAQEHQNLGLYQHRVKIKLEGSYFQLRDYLSKLETLSWSFFWESFEYKLTEYPKSELEIEIYSLSTHSKYIGV